MLYVCVAKPFNRRIINTDDVKSNGRACRAAWRRSLITFGTCRVTRARVPRVTSSTTTSAQTLSSPVSAIRSSQMELTNCETDRIIRVEIMAFDASMSTIIRRHPGLARIQLLLLLFNYVNLWMFTELSSSPNVEPEKRPEFRVRKKTHGHRKYGTMKFLHYDQGRGEGFGSLKTDILMRPPDWHTLWEVHRII